MEKKYRRRREPLNLNGAPTLVAMPRFLEQVKALKKLIEKRGTPTDIVVPEFGLRASGEPFLQLGQEHVCGHDCFVITSGPGTYTMLGQLQILLGYLVGRHARRITVVTGYLPLGRSDKDEGELELALLPLVMRMIVSAAYNKLDRIISVDLHCPQNVMAAPELGLLTEIKLVRRILLKAVEDAKKTHLPICALLPDGGAINRFEDIIDSVAKELKVKLPVMHGNKIRKNSRSSRLTGLFGDTEKVKGAIVLGMDDEFATGGTTCGTAKIVLGNKYHAAQYWGVVTQGVLCEQAPSLLTDPNCPVSHLYVANTIPPENRPELRPLLKSGRLQYFSWLSDLAKIIYFHHKNVVIRELR